MKRNYQSRVLTILVFSSVLVFSIVHSGSISHRQTTFIFPTLRALSFSARMISQALLQSQSPPLPSLSIRSAIPIPNRRYLSFSSPDQPSLRFPSTIRTSTVMPCNSKLDVTDSFAAQPPLDDRQIDRFAAVANKLADAAGEVIRKYFRKNFQIVDKDDMSPVTIADRSAEEAMVSIILENFPTHAIYGEENGWRCKENSADYVWVLDPIDGTKSFITGKPLFGTLIALLCKGKPILGIIDQPILRERWLGIAGRRTMLNGEEVATRTCATLSQAYLYTTSPHLFSGGAEDAFIRVRKKVKVPLYGCDCYAYALLASGFVDLVVESGLKPYDFLALVPVIEGAGGVITDWKGQKLHWEASPQSQATSFNVVAAGDRQVHQQALDALEWP